jgi:hypothetical protein
MQTKIVRYNLVLYVLFLPKITAKLHYKTVKFGLICVGRVVCDYN